MLFCLVLQQYELEQAIVWKRNMDNSGTKPEREDAGLIKLSVKASSERRWVHIVLRNMSSNRYKNTGINERKQDRKPNQDFSKHENPLIRNLGLTE